MCLPVGFGLENYDDQGRYREADSCLTHSYAILSKNGGAPLIYRTIAQRYLDTLHRTV